MFTRAELTKLSGLNHTTTYRLEERGLLVPYQGGYSYNQVIFGRFIEQLRHAIGVTSIKFAERFGTNAQFEIDWVNTHAVMYIGQGFGLIEHDFSSVEQEWLLPLDKEAFLFEDNPEVGKIFEECFRFKIVDNCPVVYICLNRVRSAIYKIALEKKIKELGRHLSDSQKKVLTA